MINNGYILWTKIKSIFCTIFIANLLIKFCLAWIIIIIKIIQFSNILINSKKKKSKKKNNEQIKKKKKKIIFFFKINIKNNLYK